MHDCLTAATRAAIEAARTEARALRWNEVRTEHLLLGILHNREGIPSRILGDKGVDLEKARAKVAELYGYGDGSPPGKALPFSDYSRRVLESAALEKPDFRHEYVAPEHIVLALLHPELNEDHGNELLYRLGINHAWLRQHIVRLIRTESWRHLTDEQAYEGIFTAFEKARRTGDKRLVWEAFAALGYVGPIPEAKFVHSKDEVVTGFIKFTLPSGKMSYYKI